MHTNASMSVTLCKISRAYLVLSGARRVKYESAKVMPAVAKRNPHQHVYPLKVLESAMAIGNATPNYY